jgi:EamA domain-containing membrane protein RarD
LSTEKLFGAALPPTTCLAAAGVQLVANLLETLSIVELWLVVAFGLYHEGKISVVGDGSIEPTPTVFWLLPLIERLGAAFRVIDF